MSISSVLLSVAVARVENANGFGSFALAQLLFVLSSGLVAATITDTALVQSREKPVGIGFERAMLLTLPIALALLAGAVVSGSTYLLVLAVALPGMIALDYSRTVETSVSSVRAGLWLGLGWAGISSVISIASLFVTFPGPVIFGAWAGSGALLGLGGMLALGYPRTPRWGATSTETRRAILFAGDYMVGSGGSAVSTAILAPFVGVAVVGALRGAGTLLGPVNVVASSVRLVLLPYLGSAGSPSLAVARAGRGLFALLCVCVPLIGLVLLIPDGVGVMLLGASWPAASAVLSPLALESLLGLVSNVAAAGHRAAMAARRTLFLRLSVGLPRPFLVLGAAWLGGAGGAAWMMAGLAGVNAVVWWVSYLQLAARGAQEGVANSDQATIPPAV